MPGSPVLLWRKDGELSIAAIHLKKYLFIRNPGNKDFIFFFMSS
jgi:hypothetical protein